MSADLVQRDDTVVFELDQRRAKAYAESGYWPDTASIAKALVKIEAGRSLNLAPIIAMSEIHVIDGKPTVGAGAQAALVKASGRYDYRVVQLDQERCELQFYDRGEPLTPTSVFTMEDARTAGLLNKGPWKQYPRNMLFARAISNGVAWHCPDVTSGRIYTPDELDGAVDATFEPIVDEKPEPALPPQEQALIDEFQDTFDAAAIYVESGPTVVEQLNGLIADLLDSNLLSVSDLWAQVAAFRRRPINELILEIGPANGGPLTWPRLRDNLRPQEAADLLAALTAKTAELGIDPDDPPI